MDVFAELADNEALSCSQVVWVNSRKRHRLAVFRARPSAPKGWRDWSGEFWEGRKPIGTQTMEVLWQAWQYGHGEASKCCKAIYVEDSGLLTFLLFGNDISIR